MGKWIATAMIVLSILAAVAYAYQGDWRRTIYWTSAACLTASVTW